MYIETNIMHQKINLALDATKCLNNRYYLSEEDKIFLDIVKTILIDTRCILHELEKTNTEDYIEDCDDIVE